MAEGYTTNLPVSNQGPPESSEQFNAEYMSLREICEVLKSMRMKIHMSGIKVAGWECLKVKNDKYDHHRQEEGIARRKCETLQKEVKNLLVKVNCLFVILMTSVKFLKYLSLFGLQTILIFFVQVIICSSFRLKST